LHRGCSGCFQERKTGSNKSKKKQRQSTLLSTFSKGIPKLARKAFPLMAAAAAAAELMVLLAAAEGLAR